jgi:hypothetical protein
MFGIVGLVECASLLVQLQSLQRILLLDTPAKGQDEKDIIRTAVTNKRKQERKRKKELKS